MIKLEFYKGYSWAAEKLGGMCSPEFAIFTIIYSFYENKRDCFYSLSGFAKLISCSRSTVQRALKHLKAMDCIIADECNFTNSMQYIVNERTVSAWKKAWQKNNELTAKEYSFGIDPF